MSSPDAALAEAAVAAVHDATYVYRATKPSAPAGAEAGQRELLVDKAGAAAVQAGAAARPRHRCRRGGGARGRQPSRATTARPRTWPSEAKRLGKSHGLKVEVLERKDAAKLGMGSFLAVAQGSDEPPKFIVMHYQGAAKTAAPVVLVGKGITFDTGGISIKPAARDGRDEVRHGRRRQRAGHDARRGRVEAKLNVIGIIPACENMPSGRADQAGRPWSPACRARRSRSSTPTPKAA